MNRTEHETSTTSRPQANEFRHVIGHFLSGVTVVTTKLDDRRYGTTASSMTSLSLEPPMIVICMNRQSETGNAVEAAGRFAVNILGEDQSEIAIRFAGKSEDKFAGLDVSDGAWSLPLVDGALATMECRVVDAVPGGTHMVFLAEVLDARSSVGAPLAYFRSKFGRFAPQ